MVVRGRALALSSFDAETFWVGKVPMKRYFLIAAGALAAGLVPVHAALAGEGPSGYPTTPTITPTVLPTVVHNVNGGTVGGTAFTGADVVLGFVVLVALVAVGATALLLARRRAARTEAAA
jgi:hypothetical protein